MLSVGDFRKSLLAPDHRYRVELWDDTGVVFAGEISGRETTCFAIDVDPDKKFYRAEVYDAIREFPIAFGNPIWHLC